MAVVGANSDYERRLRVEDFVRRQRKLASKGFENHRDQGQCKVEPFKKTA